MSQSPMDLVLVWETPRPAVRILELKSTERLPDTLYTSYECQLYGQVGLWRFRVTQQAGRRTLNRSDLQEELEEIFSFEGLSDIDVEALLTRCERLGSPFQRLTINPIN